MKRKMISILCAMVMQLTTLGFVDAQVYMSYPGLTGESSPLWVAKETGLFKDYGIDANLVYMEGGRLSMQSLLSNSTQFMAGEQRLLKEGFIDQLYK